MAGSYPDAPSRKIAYDDDGTVCISYNKYEDSTTDDPKFPGEEVSAAQLANWNKNHNVADWGTNDFIVGSPATLDRHFIAAFIFPELREIDGVFMAESDKYTAAYADGGTVATSGNTTNGIDGTWADQASGVWFTPDTSVYQNYRSSSEIQSLAVSNVKSLRLHAYETTTAKDVQIWGISIYGEISSGETPNRLLFLDPDDSDNEFGKPLDFGDKGRGTENADTFKLKNNSGSLTANTIQVTAEALYESGGGWYTFSTDDITYYATLQITSIAAAATQLVYVKQVIPAAEMVGLHDPRVQVSVGSWT